MLVSVFVRRLKEGCTFDDFVREWEADRGFGVPTRVLNAQRLDDPRDVLTIGFVDIDPTELAGGMAAVADQEAVRHERIDTVIESTTLKAMFEVRSEHDFTTLPQPIALTGPDSLLHTLRAERDAG